MNRLGVQLRLDAHLPVRLPRSGPSLVGTEASFKHIGPSRHARQPRQLPDRVDKTAGRLALTSLQEPLRANHPPQPDTNISANPITKAIRSKDGATVLWGSHGTEIGHGRRSASAFPVREADRPSSDARSKSWD
jgi:hypothetical protein